MCAVWCHRTGTKNNWTFCIQYILEYYTLTQLLLLIIQVCQASSVPFILPRGPEYIRVKT